VPPRAAAALVAICAALLFAGTARGHDMTPALLSIEAAGSGAYDVTFTLPAEGQRPMPLSTRFPERCSRAGPANERSEPRAIVRSFRLSCGAPLDGERVAVDGLSATGADVLVRVLAEDGTVQTGRLFPEAPSLLVRGRTTALDVAGTYLVLGTQHILLGLDHLLFVLALLVLIERRGVLLWTITAFTAAHSITLALSALGLASAPQRTVEILALSIVFLAAEILKRGRPADDRSRLLSPPAVAFAFGLLHGLGFGGALRQIGLPDREIPLALLAFNVGVEAGQLLVVAIALAAAASLDRLLAARIPGLRQASAYAIGILAATWFAERLAAAVLGA